MKNLVFKTSLLLLLLTVTFSECHSAEKKAEAAKPVAPAAPPAAAEDTDGDEAEAKPGDAKIGIEEQLKELKLQVDKLRKETGARKRLEVSEEEKGKKAEEILSAAGREYTLLKKGSTSIEYGFNYSYFSGDVIKDTAIVEKRSNHNLTNQFYVEYGLKDNFSVNASIPFAYKYNRVGTDRAQDASDFGDVSVGMQMQPIKAGGDMPALIFSGGLTLPFGTSPYEINTEETLPTGSGFYGVNAGVSLSKTMDPLIAFGNLSYNYNFAARDLNQNWRDGRNLTTVEPGSSIGLAMGFGYALSYKASLNMSVQANYAFSNEYRFSNAASYSSGSSLSSTFYIGTGWRVTPNRTVSLKLGIGLTSNDPDFSFSIRVPFEF